MNRLGSRWMLALSLGVFFLQTSLYPAFRWVEDESWYSSVAYSLQHEGRIRNPTFQEIFLESQVDPRPPLMPITVSSSFRLLGVGPVQARLPGILAGAGTVVATYLLGAALVSPPVGGLAALLVSTDTFLVATSRTVRPECYTALWSAIGIWLFVLARNRRSVWVSLASGLAIGVAVNYHVNGLAALASCGLVLLVDRGLALIREKRAWIIVLGVAITLIPTVLWLRSTPTHIQSFQRLYGRGQATDWKLFTLQETSRYTDLIGLSSKRVKLPFPLPLRLHIVAGMAAALALLLYKKPAIGIPLALFVLPGPILWAVEKNPSVRFFSIPAAYLAVALAAAVWIFIEKKEYFRIALGAVALIFLTQFAGNILLLRASRTADYPTLTKRLREVIPAGASVYGAVTFWMALHDHTYRSYNGAELLYALDDLKIDYVISNDRVLVSGSGYWEDSFAGKREEFNRLLPQRGTLVSKVPDPFYGDLEIWRMNHAPPSPSSSK